MATRPKPKPEFPFGTIFQYAPDCDGKKKVSYTSIVIGPQPGIPTKGLATFTIYSRWPSSNPFGWDPVSLLHGDSAPILKRGSEE